MIDIIFDVFLFQFETVPVLHCYNAHAVVLTHKSGWKLAYSGDCLPSDRLVKAGKLSIIHLHTKISKVGVESIVFSIIPGYPPMYVMVQVRIADVSVRKRHQRLGEIMIIFTHTSSKTCFQKSSVMQYMPLTLNAIQFAQHTLARLL